jgi:hypothetical protein
MKTSLLMTLGWKTNQNNLIETSGTVKQFYLNINAMHNLQFNKNNSINITSQSFYLRSNNT